jgi:hypothetical protein
LVPGDEFFDNIEAELAAAEQSPRR